MNSQTRLICSLLSLYSHSLQSKQALKSINKHSVRKVSIVNFPLPSEKLYQLEAYFQFGTPKFIHIVNLYPLHHSPRSPMIIDQMVPFFSLISLRPKIPRPSPLLLIIGLPFSSYSSSPQPPAVGVFWDLDNKPPNSVPPYDAAIRLRLAASSFGPVASVSAFANPHAFLHLPSPLRSALLLRRRRSLHLLEGDSSYLCRVCGRNFRHHPALLNHFDQIHRREQTKRLNRINSARGAQKARLAAALSMKMKKFDKAARELLLPEEDKYSLASELKRAGVFVKEVDDRPEAADRALKAHMVDAMDKGRIGCLVLVSDDKGFSEVIREARMRCLMTVVIGDEWDGGLRRCADAGYSWREVVTGKARREGGKARGRWMDKGLLKGLEWRRCEEEGEESDWDGDDDDDDENGEGSDSSGKRGNEPWWKLD